NGRALVALCLDLPARQCAGVNGQPSKPRQPSCTSIVEDRRISAAKLGNTSRSSGADSAVALGVGVPTSQSVGCVRTAILVVIMTPELARSWQLPGRRPGRLSACQARLDRLGTSAS